MLFGLRVSRLELAYITLLPHLPTAPSSWLLKSAVCVIVHRIQGTLGPRRHLCPRRVERLLRRRDQARSCNRWRHGRRGIYVIGFRGHLDSDLCTCSDRGDFCCLIRGRGQARGGAFLGCYRSSSDFGATWTAQTFPPVITLSVASSADGTKLTAAGIGIYTSSDSGGTWTLTSAPTDSFWQSIAFSADGTKLVAVGGDGMYASSDSGVTWTLMAASPSGPLGKELWRLVACSGDGTKLVADMVLNHSGTLLVEYTPH